MRPQPIGQGWVLVVGRDLGKSGSRLTEDRQGEAKSLLYAQNAQTAEKSLSASALSPPVPHTVTGRQG